jgi:hypothetical protein
MRTGRLKVLVVPVQLVQIFKTFTRVIPLKESKSSSASLTLLLRFLPSFEVPVQASCFWSTVVTYFEV